MYATDNFDCTTVGAMIDILIYNFDSRRATHVHGPQWLKNKSQMLIYWNLRFRYGNNIGFKSWLMIPDSV